MDKESGWGHAKRSFALKGILEKNSDRTTYIYCCSANSGDSVLCDGYDLVSLSDIDVDFLICDFPKYFQLPKFLKEILSSKRSEGVHIVNVDDCWDLRDLSDYALIPNFLADLGSAPSYKKFFWGLEYVPLTSRPFDSKVRSCLITVGATDKYHLAKDLFGNLSSISKLFDHVYFVEPQNWSNTDELVQDATNVEVIKGKNDLTSLYEKSSHAIVCFGFSFFECLAYGVQPYVIFPDRKEDPKLIDHISSAGFECWDISRIDIEDYVKTFVYSNNNRLIADTGARLGTGYKNFLEELIGIYRS